MEKTVRSGFAAIHPFGMHPIQITHKVSNLPVENAVCRIAKYPQVEALSRAAAVIQAETLADDRFISELWR
jgi:hypothetical protein